MRLPDNSDTACLIKADWLEDHGRADDARWLREEVTEGPNVGGIGGIGGIGGSFGVGGLRSGSTDVDVGVGHDGVGLVYDIGGGGRDRDSAVGFVDGYGGLGDFGRFGDRRGVGY